MEENIHPLCELIGRKYELYVSTKLSCATMGKFYEILQINNSYYFRNITANYDET
jgi:hypothetical protein